MSSLDAQTTLLVLSSCGSNILFHAVNGQKTQDFFFFSQNSAHLVFHPVSDRLRSYFHTEYIRFLSTVNRQELKTFKIIPVIILIKKHFGFEMQ